MNNIKGLNNEIEISQEYNTITSNALASAEIAKVQAQIFLAKTYPRNMREVEKKIESACERKSLAERAEYEYTRGGTKITGATIRLVETVAQCYGNLIFNWRELERTKEKSKVIALAWDLESNVKYELEFEVSLYRSTKTAKTLLTEDRDIYELISNNASRRLRKCLESIIPRDIIERAREMCTETLSSKVDYQAGIDKAINYFEETHGIKLEQIEKKFGMNRRGFTKNTYISLQKIFNSLKDGIAKVGDIFPSEELKHEDTESVKQEQVEKTNSKIVNVEEIEEVDFL